MKLGHVRFHNPGRSDGLSEVVGVTVKLAKRDVLKVMLAVAVTEFVVHMPIGVLRKRVIDKAANALDKKLAEAVNREAAEMWENKG